MHILLGNVPQIFCISSHINECFNKSNRPNKSDQHKILWNKFFLLISLREIHVKKNWLSFYCNNQWFAILLTKAIGLRTSHNTPGWGTIPCIRTKRPASILASWLGRLGTSPVSSIGMGQDSSTTHFMENQDSPITRDLKPC